MAGPVPTAIAEEKTPTIPTSGAAQQATAAQGVDLLSELMKQGSDADLAAEQAAKAATVPIPGGHTTPQAVMLPGGGQPHPQLAMDTNPVVGHHQAMMRGVANATRGVANMVSALSTQVEQKQTQRLAVNMERLMTATQSIDQAKQVLQSDPNNKDAQDQLKKSGAIMDEVLSDDKTRKSIQKAYNINFTDPSKNNTKEHAALKMATDNYKEQFQKQLPQQMAPNQAAVEHAKLAAEQAKATHKTIDAIVPAMMRLQGTEYSADVRAQTQKAIETQKEYAQVLLQHQKAEDAFKLGMNRTALANAGHLSAVMFAQRHEDARNEARIKAQLAKAGGDPNHIPIKDIQANINNLDKQIKEYPTTYAQLVKARDHVQADIKKKGKESRFSNDALLNHNHMLFYEEKQNEANEASRKFWQDQLNKRLSGGNIGQYSAPPAPAAGSEPPPDNAPATAVAEQSDQEYIDEQEPHDPDDDSNPN